MATFNKFIDKFNVLCVVVQCGKSNVVGSENAPGHLTKAAKACDDNGRFICFADAVIDLGAVARAKELAVCNDKGGGECH